MTMPVGLEMWEVMTISALCSLTVLSVVCVSTTVIAYLATREPRAVAHPTAKPVQTPPAVAPTFTPAPTAG